MNDKQRKERILAQLDEYFMQESYEDDDMVVICPDCNKEIGRYYDCFSQIEEGKCPFCDCDIEEGLGGNNEQCFDCPNYCADKHARREEEYLAMAEDLIIRDAILDAKQIF